MLKNIKLEEQLLVKSILVLFIFEDFYLVNSCLIFDGSFQVSSDSYERNNYKYRVDQWSKLLLWLNVQLFTKILKVIYKLLTYYFEHLYAVQWRQSNYVSYNEDENCSSSLPNLVKRKPASVFWEEMFAHMWYDARGFPGRQGLYDSTMTHHSHQAVT